MKGPVADIVYATFSGIALLLGLLLLWSPSLMAQLRNLL